MRPPLPPRDSVRRAARRIEREGERQASAQALGDLALLRLLAGRVGEAVALLEESCKREPANAHLASDLAVAYLDRAGEGARPHDLVLALAAADRAVRIDPFLAEAQFNRALALGELSLRADASAAWRDLLARHPNSGWIEEGRGHLRNLEAPTDSEIWPRQRKLLDEAAIHGDARAVRALIDRFPQAARQYAEEELLPAWGEVTSRGRARDALRPLRIARAIGAAVTRRNGDGMVADAVAVIDRSLFSTADPEQLQRLARGFAAYGSGLRAFRRREIESARPALTKAEHAFDRAGTPFASRARFYLACCDYFHADFERAGAALDRLRRFTAVERYPSLAGEILWVKGSIDLVRGQPGSSLAPLEGALKILARTGEIENTAAQHQTLAIAFGYLGSDELWPHLFQALLALPHVQSYRRAFGTLDEMAIACQRAGESGVALYFDNELLARAMRFGDPEQIAEALLRRARTFEVLHSTGRALEDLAAAEARATTVADAEIRARVRADIRALEGELILAFDPAAAGSALTDAIAALTGSNYQIDISLDLFLRARARLAAGDVQRAEEDYETGLREIERLRGGAIDPRLRIAVLDQATALVDEILGFEVTHGHSETAFAVAERTRARQLLDEVARAPLSAPARRKDTSPRILPSAEIRRELPAGTAIIKYAVLGDRLLIWALCGERTEFRQVAVSAAELTSRIERVRQGMEARKSKAHLIADLKQLYSWLVEPLADILRPRWDVVFVPDKSLHRLPFAALVNPRTGRYLVQDHAAAMAPSANLYFRILEQLQRAHPRRPATALVVGDPSFDRQRFPALPELPGAEREATLVAAAYPRAQLLVGGQATRARFFAEITSRFQVLHFAGHSILNPDLPEYSLLLFAGDPGKADGGAVYAHEIFGRRWNGLQLVVLSACSTAVGRLSASEGAISLARPFLAGGVPAVLANLAEVDDLRTSELLVRFHRELLGGRPPIAALRVAQLSRLGAGASSPGDWALIQLIGGSSPSTKGDRDASNFSSYGQPDGAWALCANSNRADPVR